MNYEAIQRSAIALNNMGVDLLKSGLHQDAWETLQDATVAMKHSFPPSESEIPSAAPPLDLENRIQAMVQRGNQRFSRRVCHELDRQRDIRLCPNELVQPVRIEDVHQGFSQETILGYTEDAHMQSALMLYNFSLAGVALGQAQVKSDVTSQSLRTKLFEHALYLLHLANEVLRKLHEDVLKQAQSTDRTTDSGIDMILLHQTLSIKLRVLHAMDFSAQLNDSDEYRSPIHQHIQATLDNLSSLESLFDECHYPCIGTHSSHLAATA